MAELDQTIHPKSEKTASGSVEVAAAMHLVELSGDHSGEGSNCNNNYDEGASAEFMMEEEEEVIGKFRPRRQRYRSLSELYKITKPVNVNRIRSRRKMTKNKCRGSS
ncbi:hypothetical protein Syun_004881 [Stephania yunnanensis]|uniref:Uncharacterized protein n=1 Tax=Stephania yunnanensis TaxID=152371 RepID=A0AAP0L7Z2_9MAGN